MVEFYVPRRWLRKALRYGIEFLTEKQRMVLYMVGGYERTYRDIAEYMGVEQRVVHKIYHGAVDKTRYYANEFLKKWKWKIEKEEQ